MPFKVFFVSIFFVVFNACPYIHSMEQQQPQKIYQPATASVTNIKSNTKTLNLAVLPIEICEKCLPDYFGQHRENSLEDTRARALLIKDIYCKYLNPHTATTQAYSATTDLKRIANPFWCFCVSLLTADVMRLTQINDLFTQHDQDLQKVLHQKMLQSIRIQPNALFLDELTGDLWDLEKRKCIFHGNRAIDCAELSADGNILATAENKNSIVRVQNIETGETIFSMENVFDRGGFTDLALSRNGTTIACKANDSGFSGPGSTFSEDMIARIDIKTKTITRYMDFENYFPTSLVKNIRICSGAKKIISTCDFGLGGPWNRFRHILGFDRNQPKVPLFWEKNHTPTRKAPILAWEQATPRNTLKTHCCCGSANDIDETAHQPQ